MSDKRVRPTKHVGGSKDNRAQSLINGPQPTAAAGAAGHEESASVKLSVVLLGSPKVGKTAICNQFLWKTFDSDRYIPTVDEFNWIEYETESGGTFTIYVIDAAGSREFIAMRNLYVRNADAFILVHAVNNRSSFDEIKQLMEDIESQSTKGAPIVIVTNKIDLTNDQNRQEHDDLISEVQKFAEDHMCQWAKCTAMDYSSVENVFMAVLREFSPVVESCSRLKKRRQSMPATTVSQNQKEMLKRRQVGGSEPVTPIIKQSQQRCTVS